MQKNYLKSRDMLWLPALASTHYYNTKHGLIPEEAVSFCSIPDYVAFSIAREKAPLLHQSMAASLEVYDIQKGCFDTEAIERAGMDIRMLLQVTKRECFVRKDSGRYSGSSLWGIIRPAF